MRRINHSSRNAMRGINITNKRGNIGILPTSVIIYILDPTRVSVEGLGRGLTAPRLYWYRRDHCFIVVCLFLCQLRICIYQCCRIVTICIVSLPWNLILSGTNVPNIHDTKAIYYFLYISVFYHIYVYRGFSVSVSVMAPGRPQGSPGRHQGFTY